MYIHSSTHACVRINDKDMVSLITDISYLVLNSVIIFSAFVLQLLLIVAIGYRYMVSQNETGRNGSSVLLTVRLPYLLWEYRSPWQPISQILVSSLPSV